MAAVQGQEEVKAPPGRGCAERQGQRPDDEHRPRDDYGRHRRALEPTQLLIEIATPDGKKTGLRQDSVVNCINLLTVEQNKIIAVIGTLSASLVQKVNACLKVALELP